MIEHKCLLLPHATNKAAHWVGVYMNFMYPDKPANILNMDVRWQTVAAILDPIVLKTVAR